MIKETLDLLGYRVKDKITGVEGLVEAVSFDLYGSIQVVILPADHDTGKLEGYEIFDIRRIEKQDGDRVMAPPDFEADGTTAELNLLGYTAKDKVTGFTGVRTMVTFDLYGCVQVQLRPPVTRDSRLPAPLLFDIGRLSKVKVARVLAPPDYASMGAPATHKHGPSKNWRFAQA